MQFDSICKVRSIDMIHIDWLLSCHVTSWNRVQFPWLQFPFSIQQYYIWPEIYLHLFTATVSQRFFHHLKRWYKSKRLLKPPRESCDIEFRITMAHHTWIELNNNIIIRILCWIEHEGRTRQSIATSESKNHLCYQQ